MSQIFIQKKMGAELYRCMETVCLLSHPECNLMVAMYVKSVPFQVYMLEITKITYRCCTMNV